VSGGASVVELADKSLNGPVTYGGYGCPDSAPVPQASRTGLQPGEEAIVVLQRGPVGDTSAPEEACFPGDKAASAAAAGYDAMILANHHTGHDLNGEAYCGAGGYPDGLRMPTVCTTHDALHALFGKQVESKYEAYLPAKEPTIGQVSVAKVSAASVFDGWGYVHLFDAKPTKGKKLTELDTYAVDQAHDPDFATGYGDLSVHEVATSVQHNDLAYYSYYSAGMRVTKIVNNELVEVGRWMDPRGSDFWGVEAFMVGDQEYFAGSDRNFGLQIFKYTGTE
jgi:hypothetical protein